MSLKELVKRLTHINKFKSDKKKVELKNLSTILHQVIAYGNSPTKKNNDKFQRYLNKVFDDNKPQKEESFEDIENLIGKGNVKK